MSRCSPLIRKNKIMAGHACIPEIGLQAVLQHTVTGYEQQSTMKGGSRLWAIVQEKFVALFWTCLAAFLVLFGNGEYDLITLVLTSRDVTRPFVYISLGCWALNAFLFIYVYGWLQHIKGVEKPLDLVPWVMQLGAACFATAFVSMTLGIWPVFSFLSPVIVVAVTYGSIMSLNFIPHFGLLQPRDMGGGLSKKDQ